MARTSNKNRGKRRREEIRQLKAQQAQEAALAAQDVQEVELLLDVDEDPAPVVKKARRHGKRTKNRTHDFIAVVSATHPEDLPDVIDLETRFEATPKITLTRMDTTFGPNPCYKLTWMKAQRTVRAVVQNGLPSNGLQLLHLWNIIC